MDEGILRLTRFASPDPAAHFLGRRRLGLDIRDDWGRLIAPAEGEATALSQGGDEGSFVLPDIPQRTVTLFTPPVQAGADGVASIPLDLPDFNGQVRLMAVAWHGSRDRRRGRATSSCATRWWPRRCCRASSPPATRRGWRCCCTTSTCRRARRRRR